MTRVTSGKSRVRESHLPGSVKGGAEWPSYSTTIRGGRGAVLGVEQTLPLQQDAGEPEQSVGNPAQGAAIRVTARSQSLIAGTATRAWWNTAWCSQCQGCNRPA
jgi:hypothetical protein